MPLLPALPQRSPGRRPVVTGLIGILAAILAGPLPARAEDAASGAPLPVVASFSILGDMVAVVGGDHVRVTTLVGPNGDAHVFNPSPADARTLSQAKLVVINGLGLEGWLPRLIKASGTKAPTVVAAAAVKPLSMVEDENGQARTITDPHAWQDIANARLYVAAIRDGLAGADPAHAADYAAHAARYTAELDALEGEVRQDIGRIPGDRRKIITTHDAFGYFGKAYGMAFIAPQGVSTEAEASARDVARIIRQVKAEKVPAVFLENVSDPRLMERIASESGAKVGGKLYSDALSEQGGAAGTYIEMMRNNIRELGAALSS